MILDKIKNLNSGDSLVIGKAEYQDVGGVLKSEAILASNDQKQTQETLGFKWQKEDTFDSPESLARMKRWLLERYMDPKKWIGRVSHRPVVLDAGCGAGMSGFEYWGDVLEKIQYFGIDISEAADVARKRFAEKGWSGGLFMQESISDLPFEEPFADIIFSEGVLHHTDSTEKTFNHLCQFLKKDGLFMFYVYREKGPIREFTDDYIREKLQTMGPEEAWNSLEGLTKLGIVLGDLDIEVDVPQNVDFLDIPAGKINLQRLFYWHVFKAFYDPKLSFEEMHHINFDWYAPKNAHRHTLEEVKQWCKNNGLEIQHEKEELAGIAIVAKKV